MLLAAPAPQRFVSPPLQVSHRFHLSIRPISLSLIERKPDDDQPVILDPTKHSDFYVKHFIADAQSVENLLSLLLLFSMPLHPNLIERTTTISLKKISHDKR